MHLKSNLQNNYEAEDSFLNILNECTKYKVDLLLIAGDFFDDTNLESFKIKNIKQELKNFGIKTFISPGNHDPFTSDSPYNASDWPENVYIFKESKFSYVQLPDLKLRVWGAAFNSAYETKSMLKISENFKYDDFINICIIHGTITNNIANEYYNPIKIKDIRESNMDYIALGHIHKRSPILKESNTFYAYCGSAFSRGFSETGEKGIYIGTVSKKECDLKFVKTCKRSYEKISIDISQIMDHEEIIKLILEKTKSLCKENYSDNLYEITITGNVDESLIIDFNYINFKLKRELFFTRFIDKTEPKIDIQTLSSRKDFKGIFIKKTLKFIEDSTNDEEKRLRKNALKLGLKAFREEVLYSDN